MRIAILGSGGVGGYFGARLAAAGGPISTSRSSPAAPISSDADARTARHQPVGNLDLPRVNATDDPAAVGPVDVVFFTVKLANAARR
jgi:2-dehydropantoate 2-reductase